MSATSDYYTILRVDPAAKREVIRAAYVSLAKEHHPDAGGAAERMVALNEAWAVLGDVKRRAAYDQARGATPSPQPARAARSDPSDPGTVYTPPLSRAATGSYTTRDFERYSG
jgi:curved DNA-binding protein CbpA